MQKNSKFVLILLFSALSLICGDGLGYDFWGRDDGYESNKLPTEYYRALGRAHEQKFREQKAILEDMFKDKPTAQDLCLKHTEQVLKQAVKDQTSVGTWESNHWFVKYAITSTSMGNGMNANPLYQKSQAAEQLSTERVALLQKAIALKPKEDKTEKKSQRKDESKPTKEAQKKYDDRSWDE